ncbi:stalk domain-containing protein [Crassaminicella profunda]|uniref:stalk domain-containing protein n=1 Tax=Crassaminicella profunda TaxID=1286698 RepID=UPI001CA61683|nr:stalk domain-containing protein [Crassaminicella profunda]QZY54116.1 TolC family protein [Crassaminicella profunda]
MKDKIKEKILIGGIRRIMKTNLMKNRMMGCIVIMIFMCSMFVGNAFAEELIQLPTDFADANIMDVKLIANEKNYQVGEKVMLLKVAPYIKEDSFMLPLEFLLDMMGMKQENMTWDQGTNVIRLFKGDNIIQMAIGKSQWRIDGRSIEMKTQVELKDGVVMVPLSMATKVWDTKYTYNSLTKTVTFSIQKEKKEVLKKGDYTYEELLERVYKYSRDLKRLDMNVDRAEMNKDEAKDRVKSTPIGTGNGEDDAARTSDYLELEQNRIELKKAENNIDMKKDQLAYDFKKAYDNILKQEDHMKIKKLELEIANENMKQMRIKYEYGSVSENEKIQAKRDEDQAKKDYEMALEDLDKDYEKLNDMVGFKKEERYSLEDRISFDVMDDEDVEYHIARMISISPEIWGSEQSVRMKDLGVKLYTFNAGGPSYGSKKMDLKEANMDLGDKKKAYGEKLRNTYKILKRYKDEYNNSILSYEKAKDDLKKAKIDLEIGSMTPIEFKRKTLDLEREKKNLKDKIMDYNELLMKYDKPWIN